MFMHFQYSYDLSYDIGYDFYIKRFSVHFFPDLFVGWLVSFLCYLCLLLNLMSNLFFRKVCVAHIFSFCVVLSYVFPFLSSVVWCPLRFTHKNDDRFVFNSSCLLESTCLNYVICVCLPTLLSNTYCVVFLVLIWLFCLPYAASISALSIFYFPFGIL